MQRTHRDHMRIEDMAKMVLLVEDDEDNRDLVRFVLQRSKLGVELLIAEGAVQDTKGLSVKMASPSVETGLHYRQTVSAKGVMSALRSRLHLLAM